LSRLEHARSIKTELVGHERYSDDRDTRIGVTLRVLIVIDAR
jgi:hypothetical protein